MNNNGTKPNFIRKILKQNQSWLPKIGTNPYFFVKKWNKPGLRRKKLEQTPNTNFVMENLKNLTFFVRNWNKPRICCKKLDKPKIFHKNWNKLHFFHKILSKPNFIRKILEENLSWLPNIGTNPYFVVKKWNEPGLHKKKLEQIPILSYKI